MEKRIVKLGIVGVDSGHLLICDPGHLTGEFSYGDVIKAAENKEGGQINFKLGHPGAGVSFHTAFGDGIFEVFAELVETPDAGERVKRVWVEIITDDELAEMKSDFSAENN